MFRTRMPVLRRQNILWRTVLLLGGKAGICIQARELVIMSEPKSIPPPQPSCRPSYPRKYSLRVNENLIAFSLKPNASWTTHQRRKKKEKKGEILSLDSSCHKTRDTAFTTATPHQLRHSRANTDSHNSHSTQHTRVKQNALFFTQKGTQPSLICSRRQITPIRPKIDAGDASLLMGSIN